MERLNYLRNLKSNIDSLLTNHKFQTTTLQNIISTGLKYVSHHHKTGDEKFSNMMLQMALCKANSILTLSNGMSFSSKENESHNAFIDIHSMSSIFRSLYENYGYFNHLFIQGWNEEEFIVLYNMWKICSLNQRLNLVKKNTSPLSDENSTKIKKEKEFVNKLISEIKSTSIYSSNQKKIDDYIKNNRWQLTINKGRVQNISWKNIYANTNKNHSEDSRSYQMLSLDAHPSYYSVFQFGDLYKNRHDLERRGTLLYQTIQIISCYLFDFRKLMPSLDSISIDQELLFLIDFLGKDVNKNEN
nr:hypothetical protein [Allomuricauda sp.]